MTFLLYGSYGYTGQLIAETAIEQGLRPTLAGRDEAKLRSQAEALDLEWRVAAVDDPAALDAAVRGHACVLNCAGPFEETAQRMVDACLRTGAHYLDITGEIAVFESLAGRHDEAVAAGVMLLPGVGFDVVPSDRLARELVGLLPDATELVLAVRPRGQASRGTALTAIASLGRPLLCRRGGVLVPVPASDRTRAVDFGSGPEQTIALSWGDVATAWRTTGIPDITVYFALPATVRLALRLADRVRDVVGTPWLKEMLARRVQRGVTGPSAEARAQGEMRLYGMVRNVEGSVVERRITAPEAYSGTAQYALEMVGRVLEGKARPGYWTPAGWERRDG